MIPFLAAALDLNRLPLFPLGQVVATRGALDLLKQTQTEPDKLLALHVTGDWGDCDPEDVQTNVEALKHGARLMSVYRLPLGTGRRHDQPIRELADDLADRTVWVITEADRAVTTLLLPSEY